MLTNEQLRQALKKLGSDTLKKPPKISDEVWKELLSLSPRERAGLALKEMEDLGGFE